MEGSRRQALFDYGGVCVSLSSWTVWLTPGVLSTLAPSVLAPSEEGVLASEKAEA